MAKRKTNIVETPIVSGMQIWANVWGFSVNKTPSTVASIRKDGRYYMVTIEGSTEEIPLTSRTPYWLYS